MLSITTAPWVSRQTAASPSFLIPVDTRQLSPMATSLLVSSGLQRTATTELLSDTGVSLPSPFLISLMGSVLLALPGQIHLGFLVSCNKSVLMHPLLLMLSYGHSDTFEELSLLTSWRSMLELALGVLARH